MRLRILLIPLWLAATRCGGQPPMSLPDSFPRFEVPGQEKAMTALRDLFWLHYTEAGPKATLWDEWLCEPALWPATETENGAQRFRREWSDALTHRIQDAEGYIATHQHASIAHPLGWPFPFWNQGQGGFGWHFSFKDTVGPPWRTDKLSTPESWNLAGARPEGIGEYGWNITLTSPEATLTTPQQKIDTFQAPFLQLRWKAVGLGNARPYIAWTTAQAPKFTPERRVYFERTTGDAVHHAVIPMFRHPLWKGEITQLRIGFEQAAPKASLTVQALFTQYDTRHNINEANFVRGCAHYFRWTRDLDFLRRNIGRMRLALRYIMSEHHALERKVVYTTWIGHDGRTGLGKTPEGKKRLLSGHGIGNNYWDLLPFGNLDCYATIQYYDATRHLAALERAIRDHPEWNIPLGVSAFDPEFLEKHAVQVKAEGNRLFWNAQTGRFAACVDADGKMHDYGFTFLNCEAIYYDFATPAHARSILQWLRGERLIAGDTAQGADIYHWRFGPRATTKRNIEWYGWFWSGPETIKWGGQVQDGGAVLGFAYHDLMARLKIVGPDDAWARLQETIRWFEEVQKAGGYRKYYAGNPDVTLQGGGTAGGLGLDFEFFESVLVPQVMLRGFLGFEARPDGFALNPRLPRNWPSLTITRIRLHDSVLNITVTPRTIKVVCLSGPKTEWRIALTGSNWSSPQSAATPHKKGTTFCLTVDAEQSYTFER